MSMQFLVDIFKLTLTHCNSVSFGFNCPLRKASCIAHVHNEGKNI